MVDFSNATDILFGSSKVTKIGDLEVDATIVRSLVFDAVMTQHAVEEGADITDHHEPLPDILMIEGIISAAPLETGYPGQTTVSAIKSLATGNGDFLKDAFDLLKKYRDESEVLEVFTTRHAFDDMLITSLVFDDNSPRNQLNFSLTVEKARFVSVGQAGLLALGKDVAKNAKEVDNNGDDGNTAQAKTEKNNGKQTNKPASNAESTKSESILHGLIF